MAVTIAETSGHVTETELKSPLSPPVTMRRNDRSHSPKYAVSDGNSDVKVISMSMKLALNRAEMSRESMIQATEWLDAKGVYYRHLPPSQLKIGPINYWPSTGTITVDNETGKRPYLGLQGLELVLQELQGRYPVRRST